ncbi:MAG: hypothetical protein DIU78_005705 [Pseudomonadota bacterium]
MRRALLGLALVLFAQSAAADGVRVVERARVTLGDLLDGAPAALRTLDVGPAPPPGGTRQILRADVVRALEERGIAPSAVQVPASVRVKSAARRLTGEEFSAWVRPQVVAALPEGVTLEQLLPGRPLVISPRTEIVGVRMPKLPKREGTVKATVSVELLTEGAAAPMVVPVTGAFRIGPEAARFAVERGAELVAFVERGPARIGAVAVALDQADVGEVLSVQIVRTRKVVRARLESKSAARVIVE